MYVFVYVATFKKCLFLTIPLCFPPPEKDETGQVLGLYKKKNRKKTGYVPDQTG